MVIPSCVPHASGSLLGPKACFFRAQRLYPPLRVLLEPRGACCVLYEYGLKHVYCLKHLPRLCSLTGEYAFSGVPDVCLHYVASSHYSDTLTPAENVQHCLTKKNVQASKKEEK